MASDNNRKYPPLCGGTFFSVLIPYRGDRVPPKRYYEKIKDPKSDIPTLISLICVVKPDYEKKLPAYSSIGTYTSQFRNCREKIPKGLFIGKPDYKASFEDQMDNSYETLLWKLHTFLDSNIGLYDKDGNPKTAEMSQLVSEILELIDHDPACKDRMFRIGPNGEMRKIQKDGIIHFQSFMLGIWYYIVSEHINNEIAQDIYDNWMAREDKGRTIQKTYSLKIQSLAEPDEGLPSNIPDKGNADKQEEAIERISEEDVETVSESEEVESEKADGEFHNEQHQSSPQPQIVQNFANFGNGPQIAVNNGTIVLGNNR